MVYALDDLANIKSHQNSYISLPVQSNWTHLGTSQRVSNQGKYYLSITNVEQLTRGTCDTVFPENFKAGLWEKNVEQIIIEAQSSKMIVLINYKCLFL